MERFDGIRVLLTGGASGIGRATAARLVAEGAELVALDRDPDGLEQTRAAATGPGSLHTAVCDVSDADGVRATVAEAAERLGGIDVLVNVAGIQRTTPIAELDLADLRAMLEVNLVGTVLTCQETLPLLPDRRGAIVNVASIAATRGQPYMSAYAASKGAVLAFSLSLAAEVAGRGIRVVPVSPGMVDTPLTRSVVVDGLDMGYFARAIPLLGRGRPEQLAAAIAFAASPDASWSTGVELRVDGGSYL